MITETEIREKLTALLDDDLSLEDFEDWLVGQSHNMHLDSGSDAQELVEAIMLPLFEYSSGDLLYEELRQELSSVLSKAAGNIETTARLSPDAAIDSSPIVITKQSSQTRRFRSILAQLDVPARSSLSGTLVRAWLSQ